VQQKVIPLVLFPVFQLSFRVCNETLEAVRAYLKFKYAHACRVSSGYLKFDTRSSVRRGNAPGAI